jgi:hydrogenase nickel incorporation protein HypA/HybF
MHELALAQSLIDVARRQAALHHARRVNSLHLIIGEAMAVDPSSLRFCFDLLAAESPEMAGAALLIEETPHRGRCRRCGAEFAIAEFSAQCPACGAWETEVISGAEFQLQGMDIDEAEEE